MNRPDTAVILAAGMGRRLEEVFAGKPKGLLEIGGISLVGRSMNILRNSGIDRIILGTGYRAEAYKPLAEKFGAECVLNERYSGTGSMYTLYNLRSYTGGPFLLLESDLLYHPSAINLLLGDERDDVILASGPTCSGDEVFMECSADGLLVNMSKDRSVIAESGTELVGISKISAILFRQMCIFAEGPFGSRPGLEYEEALVAAAATMPVHVRKAEDLVWCEIDDPSHLKRAVEIIWPRIRTDCR